MRRMVLGTLFAFTLTAMTAIAANLRVDGKLISDASSGAPLEVASSALVENLNADLIDGFEATDLVTDVELDEYSMAYRQALFTADGTFTVPAGVTVLAVTVVGGGGGGAGGGPAELDAGGGGGGSGFVVHTNVIVVPGEELEVDVGSGGSGGAVAGDGADGGSSTLRLPAESWRVVALGGSGATGNVGGGGFFGGGGGGSAFGGDGEGGFGLFGGGAPGDGGVGGDGGSGGVGGFSGGGGGGPGGGSGGHLGSNPNGGPGSQPGAGGGGGAGMGTAGNGHSGSVLVRWVGPPHSPS